LPDERRLAQNGDPVLDEMTEFRRDAVQELRQPIEDGRIVVTRARGARWSSPRASRRLAAPAGSASRRRLVMPQIIVTAAVNDVEEWLKFKAEMVPAMSAFASDGASYVATDGSNRVASTWDVPDMEAFQAAQGSFSPELSAAAEKAGMIPSTIVVYVKK
jgi:hypothetical protein